MSSKYNSVVEIEKAFNIEEVKRALKAEMVLFYEDRTKAYEQRSLAFAEYGPKEGWIPDFKFKPLQQLVMGYLTYLEADRKSVISVVDAIEMWVYLMASDRMIVDLSEDEDRPKWVKTKGKRKRKYVPSEEAKTRLQTFYLNKAVEEKLARFKFDW